MRTVEGAENQKAHEAKDNNDVTDDNTVPVIESSSYLFVNEKVHDI